MHPLGSPFVYLYISFPIFLEGKYWYWDENVRDLKKGSGERIAKIENRLKKQTIC